jgi:hypothetical protein
MSDTVWPEILGSRRRVPQVAAETWTLTAQPSAGRLLWTEQSALLVGIDEYPDPTDGLETWVNDAFLISSDRVYLTRA